MTVGHFATGSGDSWDIQTQEPDKRMSQTYEEIAKHVARGFESDPPWLQIHGTNPCSASSARSTKSDLEENVILQGKVRWDSGRPKTKVDMVYNKPYDSVQFP